MLLAQILADRYTNITDAYFAQLLLNSQNTLNTSISNNILNTPSVLATLSAADIIDLKIIQQKKDG